MNRVVWEGQEVHFEFERNEGMDRIDGKDILGLLISEKRDKETLCKRHSLRIALNQYFWGKNG